MTTKHIPGSYEEKVKELRKVLLHRLPPIIYLSNNSEVVTKPRLGSFEVTIQPYYSDVVHEVFSKTSKLNFPTHNEIIEQLSSILIPDVVVLTYIAKLKVQVIDSFYR